MGKPIAPETEKVILDTADKQHYHEKKGLVKSESDQGEIPQEVRNAENKYQQAGNSMHNLNALLQAEKAVPNGDSDASAEGVVHTEDGYILRIDKDAAGSASPMRPMSSKAQLAMLADVPEVDPREATVDGCLCAGSNDEDKGPKCSCIGDPEFPKVDEVFSPSEITNWNGNEVHDQSQFKGATLQNLRAEGKVDSSNAVEATADGINGYLQDVSLRAEQRKGAVDKSKLAHFRATVKQLQDIVLRDPQSRDLVARRLSLLKSSVKKSQMLQDYDSVYLAPYVDDLDNYLQGVLDEVNRVEIPSLDDDEDKAIGAATLKARTTALLPLDPTKHRHDLNKAPRHGGYDETSGPNPSFAVPPVPELGDFRDKMEWQKHPFDRDQSEAKQFWKESEDEFPPQDSTMVFGAGRLRRESKTQAVHNPYGWLGAKGAEVPVTSADSEDTRTGGMFGGYANGAGVSTRKSLEAGSKLCQLVNCDNRGAIPFPPAAHARQHGLQMALAEADEEEAEAPERERPFLGDEIFDMGVDNGYNNGDVMMDPKSEEGQKNLTPMYYWARKQPRTALTHWDKANALLAAAQRSA